ncbi:MAG: response regulator [Phenylobacterium sp.]|uniref:response regulator n=1 Tax=Phenylobacterium sp. TaxID=1871053 RepID=UPI0012263623|nr:response regulator [Phenylobacterium sp.]TAL36951.1 MAG: response regulator [Phenylobacterium sp.]
MPTPPSNPAQPHRSRVELWNGLGLAAVLMFFLLSGGISYWNIATLQENNARIRQSHDVIVALDDLMATVQDAETGQRGYLLTGNDRYLEPYQKAAAAVTPGLDEVAALTRNNVVQQTNVAKLRPSLAAKMAELDQTIELRRAGGADAALAIVRTDRGRADMDAIRARMETMRQEEQRLRATRVTTMQAAQRTAVLSSALSALLGAALTVIVFLLVRNNTRARARQAWLQSGQVELSAAMMGEKSVEQLSDSILAFLARYAGAQAGALYKGEGDQFRLVASLGVPADADIPQRFTRKEGLLGHVAGEGRPVVISDIPDGYLSVGSAFGRDKPRHLLIVPALADGAVNGVIELGFLKPIDGEVQELLAQSAAAIGIALRSARYRAQLQDALEETQRQSEELQVQSEELRVTNEELEEQGRALKEQQVRLEQQQVELEQTNSQLEEQAQTLEAQRDDLERTSAAVEQKARELEQASQYKSDFLANMSHELRTPLNSLLILSKLLGDNPEGTLSDEQVKYARTIQSSGNDLLTLINDILDLSKIEAGQLQIQPERVPLQRLASDIRALFEPVAGERGLQFDIHAADDLPAIIETDRLRLEQILKNLLSNAFKFTEKGSVQLTIARAAGERLSLAVKDTGIGISSEQQQGIFEAFRQADGAISRRYGGTGLGLSISRELARLLGGAVTLESQPGQGSTFTLTVPLAYDAAEVSPHEPRPAPVDDTPAPSPRVRRKSAPARVVDDRAMLSDTRRLLLVIEDDPTFAGIVCDLSHELGFQCLVAPTAEEALELAAQFRPHAIVLDVGLPDQSGLTVLDRLKRDDATRHIPIHVISGADHSQTALSLGAVGYLLKPVEREKLSEVLQNLESQLTRSMRRVLIVEDDDVQRDAVGRLLASGDVETVGVGTAAECLDKLKSETFDCMVLDLSLPDASGFSLLETLSRGDHSFPPVIVYTGHDLSADDEQRLRRYSHSIIIKGAKSPERLLDEVLLFLHQVVADLPPEQQKMIRKARNRDSVLEGRRILVVEDDVRNVYSLTSVLEPRGAAVQIARNGEEALEALARAADGGEPMIDLVLMDVMMPVMDGLEATRRIRGDGRWGDLPIVMLTAKAMPDDQERCLEAGASDYMAKPIDVDKLLSLVRVWMPR